MKPRKTALVLGGTLPHVELIKNLQNRGFYTILIDYHENPPAKTFADLHIQKSTLEKDEVLKIAKEHGAEIVVSICVDQANAVACYVSECLGLRVPYSYETALKVTNKSLMKTIMAANGIPTAPFIVVNTHTVKNIDCSFPVVVKPSDTTGSKGVKKAKTLIELETYLAEALNISRSHEAIIEEFVDGKEIQIDFFVSNGIPKLIMVREKLSLLQQGGAVLQSAGSFVPAEISDEALLKLKVIATRLSTILNLKNTPLFIQAIVNNNEVSILEFALRIGGGLSYSMIKIITGFDIINASIGTLLGSELKCEIDTPKYKYATCLIYAYPGQFGYVVGHEELKQDDIILEYYLLKTRGMSIGTSMASTDRVAAFLIKAKEKTTLFEKIHEILNRMEVYDISDHPIMRRDIYRCQSSKT